MNFYTILLHNYVKVIQFHYLLPFGGSLVTLTEFCRTETGKLLVGIELR